MYKVKFKNAVTALELSFDQVSEFYVADMERALALASMLGKISTPEVQFGEIIVEPLNVKENEKK